MSLNTIKDREAGGKPFVVVFLAGLLAAGAVAYAAYEAVDRPQHQEPFVTSTANYYQQTMGLYRIPVPPR